MNELDKDFTEYIYKRFGLEAKEYENEECLSEWRRAKSEGVLEQLKESWI